MNPGGARLFWWSAAGALGLHAALLAAGPALQGGADLRPHLRLIELMGEAAALRSVYPPAYHALGALLSPLLGIAAYPRVFAFLSAAGLIGGFRYFQRAARLPDATAALFAWSPYLFALSWCLPKVEAAGYGLAFAGLGLLLRSRHAAVAGVLAATFWVHTAAALVFGLCGGLLALARRDGRALCALGAGCVLASPLLVAHIVAGCSPAEALLFSSGDYLRHASPPRGTAGWGTLAALVGPLSLLAAALGAPSLWRAERALALLCLAIVVLTLNELWLAPLGVGTTLNLLRGLSLLSVPIAVAGGVALALRPKLATPLVLGCALWAAGTSWQVVPDSCFVKQHDLAQIGATQVDRCRFRWHDTREAGAHITRDGF